MLDLLRGRRRRNVDPLEQASRLEAAGDPIGAIRVLTDANRSTPSREVEARLAQLRYEAVPAAPVPDVSPPLPEVPDLFPGERIPEIDASDLTAEVVRSAVEHHGSLLTRGLVGEDTSARLRHDIDMAFEACQHWIDDETDSTTDGWYRPFEHQMITDDDRKRKRGRGNVMAIESPPALFGLIEVMNDIGMGALTREYFREDPMMLARKVTLRRIPHNFGGGWHQDGAFMGRGIRSLNVWLALTHCGDIAPGLDVVGKRIDHIVKTGDGAYADWGVKPEDAQAEGGGDIIRPIFEDGDALIFDHLLLHRTGTDEGMVNERYAIETWFFAASTYAAMTASNDEGYTPRDQVPFVF